MLGVEVHPVAVLIARVTYLLAFGDRLRNHPPMSIPVYLGDSLQWNTELFLMGRSVEIKVPGGGRLDFPASVTSDPTFFDSVIQVMTELSESDSPSDALKAWLGNARPLEEQDVLTLTQTYDTLRGLRREQRDHIWGYVSRNLSRPVWLSSDAQRAHVLLGNPPWLSYRYMSREMQATFRKESDDRHIWAGGNVATQQDLSAYFFARCIQLYLRLDGTIGFVMPYATLNRKQFEGFRQGYFGRRRQSVNPFATVRFHGGLGF